jgi:hypothetical protein
MSSALYTTRLWWHSHKGAAKLWGVERKLEAAPKVLDIEVDGLDYVPEIGLVQIQPKGDRWRDMTTHEVAACDRMLRKLCEDSEW